RTRKIPMTSRRKFLTHSATLAAGIAGASSLAFTADRVPSPAQPTDTISLCGEWLFRTDPDDSGAKQEWFRSQSGDWRTVTVPHPWQIEQSLAEYRGPSWYRRTFNVPSNWSDSAVRIEFEAVFHSANVWINGQAVGEHLRKGYTAFIFDISRLLKPGQENTVV